MRKGKQSGFTLPEVLVALLIFSLIAAASVYALRLGVNARDQLGEADDALRELQLARMLIKEDMAQIVLRHVRDEFGDPAPAAFQGGRDIRRGRVEDDERILMSFTRAGWINPDARAPRSALQYVEYVRRGDQLIRRARLYLDDAGGGERIERVLFEGVEEAGVEFLSGEFRGALEWASEWPVPGATSAPPAIALTISNEAVRDLRQLFWIGERAP